MQPTPASGVHPKVASERLGHSKVGITLDLYSHVTPGSRKMRRPLVDDALKIAMQKRAPKTIRWQSGSKSKAD